MHACTCVGVRGRLYVKGKGQTKRKRERERELEEERKGGRGDTLENTF